MSFLQIQGLESPRQKRYLAFLDSYQTDASDPLHKWIGTYNLYRTIFVTFFKWLHYPDIKPKKDLNLHVSTTFQSLNAKRLRYTNPPSNKRRSFQSRGKLSISAGPCKW
jgi:hypothetical protein